MLELQEKVRVRVPRAYVEGKWEGKVPEARREERGLSQSHGIRVRSSGWFMDRSLKWRTIALFGIVVFCVATLAPSFYRQGHAADVVR